MRVRIFGGPPGSRVLQIYFSNQSSLSSISRCFAKKKKKKEDGKGLSILFKSLLIFSSRINTSDGIKVTRRKIHFKNSKTDGLKFWKIRVRSPSCAALLDSGIGPTARRGALFKTPLSEFHLNHTIHIRNRELRRLFVRSHLGLFLSQVEKSFSKWTQKSVNTGFFKRLG